MGTGPRRGGQGADSSRVLGEFKLLGMSEGCFLRWCDVGKVKLSSAACW